MNAFMLITQPKNWKITLSLRCQG
uniref:Uncharacterized protein n=1 Tax=Tetranychus urticae TaxID=32264 RepID=T1KIQ0_TETUR